RTRASLARTCSYAEPGLTRRGQEFVHFADACNRDQRRGKILQGHGARTASSPGQPVEQHRKAGTVAARDAGAIDHDGIFASAFEHQHAEFTRMTRGGKRELTLDHEAAGGSLVDLDWLFSGRLPGHAISLSLPSQTWRWRPWLRGAR